MTEILTESFCERCGTRYTFESERPRARLKGVKVLSRGLKNFVMSDETSMDEAMAAARSETDRELTTHQLDAFHKTFNFCMSCRQYTCPNCWNEAEARCLSCAPHLGQEIMPAPFPDLPAASVTPAPFPDMPATSVTPAFLRAATTSNGSNGSAHPAELIGASEVIGAAEIDAGTGDDEFDAAARLATLTGPAVEPQSVVDADISDIPYLTAAIVAPAPEPEATAAPELIGEAEVAAEPVVAEPHAIAAPELVAEPEAVMAEPEAVAGPEVVAEPAAMAEPEAVTPPEAIAASAAVAAEVVAESDAPAAPEADLAAAAIIQEAVEPDAVIADEPATTEHAAGAAVAPLAAAAVIESIVGDEPAVAVTPEEKAAAQTSGLLRRFRPGQNLDAELEAYERDHATEPITTAGVGSAGTPPASPDLSVPEVAAAAALAAPPAVPETPAPAPVVDDVVPQPVWQMVAPDPSPDASVTPPRDTPAVPAPASATPPDAAPQWPTGPQWPTAGAANGLPFLGRPAAPQGGLEALWAESSREVVATPAVAGRVNGVVQPCVSCGLSLSANARFCRRCGTPQAG